MKHIKPFKDNFKEELQDFCEANLAYLMDDGLKVDLLGADSDSYMIVHISSKQLAWESIKDHMIPFLTRLHNKYELMSVPSRGVSGDLSIKGAVWEYPKPLEFKRYPFYIRDIMGGRTYPIQIDDLVITELVFSIRK
jgi:hypothetical protein